TRAGAADARDAARGLHPRRHRRGAGAVGEDGSETRPAHPRPGAAAGDTLMTHPVHALPAAESARERAARAEAIKEAWRDGQQTPDAAAALREDPDIAADRAAALDLAYEEFCT